VRLETCRSTGLPTVVGKGNIRAHGGDIMSELVGRGWTNRRSSWCGDLLQESATAA